MTDDNELEKYVFAWKMKYGSVVNLPYDERPRLLPDPYIFHLTVANGISGDFIADIFKYLKMNDLLGSAGFVIHKYSDRTTVLLFGLGGYDVAHNGIYPYISKLYGGVTTYSFINRK